MKRNRPARIILGALTAAMLVGCEGGQIGFRGLGGQHPETDDKYSIMLFMFIDPATHIDQAQHYKTQTEKHTRWKDLFILRESQCSRLCWGRYTRVEAARKNLKKARDYVAPAGMQIYAGAIVIRLPGKDVGPPEWKLENAPGAYSVLVAVFYNVPEAKYLGRKDKAVAYCKQLREEGRKAYYHHGPSRSAVTVGSFPESAIRQDGGEILSSRMNRVLREFRYLAVNGRKERIKVASTKERHLRFDPKLWGPTKAEALETMKYAARGYHIVDQWSYPVRIPRKKVVNAPSADSHPSHPQPR